MAAAGAATAAAAAAAAQATKKLKHPYVHRKPGTCGGKPVIRGTRIKVSQIVTYYDRLGWSADEILQAHPHLTLAQVHDALSYYYDNVNEVNEDIARDREALSKLPRAPKTYLERKRAAANSHR